VAGQVAFSATGGRRGNGSAIERRSRPRRTSCSASTCRRRGLLPSWRSTATGRPGRSRVACWRRLVKRESGSDVPPASGNVLWW